MKALQGLSDYYADAMATLGKVPEGSGDVPARGDEADGGSGLSTR